MTVSKVSPGNAKAAKLNVKSAPAKARVEAAAEAKLLADAAHEAAIARTGSPVDAAEGAGGNAALILGGIAVLGGLAAAAAGGGGGDDITVTPAPVTVTPAPTPPPATYALAAGGTSVNEGSTTIFTLTTTNVTAGSPVAYTISGVDAADVVGGKLTGNATVGADGKAVIEVQLVADAATEGAETLTVTAGGKTASVSVADTSLTPAPVAKVMALTAGVDTLVGAATDDTFTATGTTITALDSLDGGAGKDALVITDAAGAMAGAFPANATLTSVESIVATSVGSIGANATAAVTNAVRGVTTYTFAAAAAGNTVSVTVNGAVTLLTAGGGTNADLATQLAAAINAAVPGAAVAAAGVVTVTGLATGAALPTVSFTGATGATTVTPAVVTAPVAVSAAVAAAAYDVSGFTDVTSYKGTSIGGTNIAAAGTQDVTITNTGGGTVTVAGGLSQTVTHSGAVALSGAKGAVTVTDAAQGASAISVTGGTSVSVTATASTGTITVGSATAKPTGAVEIAQTIAGTTAGATTTGGLVTVTGGSSVLVNEVAKASAPTATVLAKNVTLGGATVTGGASTTSVNVLQTAAQNGVAYAAAKAGVTEASTVAFAALTAGQTLALGGLTFTAGALGATAAQVAAAFASLADGAVGGGVNSAVGTFSGVLTGYNTGAASAANAVTFTSTLPGNPVDLAAAGTGAAGVTVTLDAAGVAAVLAAGKATIINGVVTVQDANYVPAGASTTKGVITTVTLGNFGAVTINDNALSTLNLTGGTSVIGLPFAIASGAVAIDNASSLLSADKTTSLALNVSGAMGAVGDAGVYKALTVNVGAAGALVAGLGMAGVTALTVTGGELDLTTAAGLIGLKTLTVTGAGGLYSGVGNLNLSALGNLTAVDTTATTGIVAVKIDAAAATYTGGAGVDIVEASANVSKAISLGGGDDTMVLAAGAVVSNNVAGGAGTDTLSMAVADAATASASTAFASYVSGFEVLELGAIGAAKTIDLANLGLTHSVSFAAGMGTAVTTLSKFASGGTVALADVTGVGGGVTLTNAAWLVPGATTDKVTLDLGSAYFLGAVPGQANDFGTFTVSGVESMSISGTQSSVDANFLPQKDGAVWEVVTVADATAVADVLTSVTISGNAKVEAILLADAVTSVNASTNTGGINFIAQAGSVVTVTGGSGNDTLFANINNLTFGDTLIGNAGNDLLVSNKGLTTLTGGAGADTFRVDAAAATKNIFTTVTDFSVGDMLELKNNGTETFTATKVTLAAGTAETLANYANAAAAGATGAANGAVKWFQFDGNTYVVEDLSNNTTFTDGTDILVKLNGLVDLSHASLGFGAGAAPILTQFA